MIHERSVREGDKVTFVRLSGLRVLRATVRGHTTTGEIEIAAGPGHHYITDYCWEGVSWLRGHVHESSPEARALLAAFTLAVSRE